MGIFNALKAAISGESTEVRQVTRTVLERLKDYFYFGNDNGNFAKYLKAYENNPLVYIVVNKIASTSSVMPLTVVDSNDKEVKKSKILEILKSPNDDQSRSEFLQEVEESLLLTGNSFILFESGEELAISDSLKVLKTDHIEPIHNSANILIRYDYIDEFGVKREYDVEDVLHMRTSNVVKNDRDNYMYGLSPLSAAWIIVKSTNEKFNAEASIFKNRGIIGILTNKSEVPMLPEERERLQSEFDGEVGGSDKFNKIKISTSDLQYIQTGMSPSDLKLIESIVNSLRLLASIYGMPSILLNDVEKSTFNNYDTAVTVAYRDVYLPLAAKINEKLSKFLSDKLEVDENLKTDTTKIDAAKVSTHPIVQALNQFDPRVQERILEAFTDNELRDTVGAESRTGGDTVRPSTRTNQNTN